MSLKYNMILLTACGTAIVIMFIVSIHDWIYETE
jgi:hypothetical protein